MLSILFSEGFDQDRTGDHEEADENSEDARRFPLNDPEEKADQEEEFEAIGKLFFLPAGRIEDPPLNHPVQTSKVEHSEYAADQKRGSEASEKKEGQKPGGPQDDQPVSFDPSKGLIAADQKTFPIDRGRWGWG